MPDTPTTTLTPEVLAELEEWIKEDEDARDYPYWVDIGPSRRLFATKAEALAFLKSLRTPEEPR